MTKHGVTGVKRHQFVIALGFVIDARRRVLMVRRNEPGIPSITNRWELPGGKVNFGEEPSSAAIREVYEETGVVTSAIVMVPFVVVAIRRVAHLHLNPIILCFRCKLLKQPPKAHRAP